MEQINKHLKKQEGFSLIEILIAIGLTGALALILMNLSQKQLKIEATSKFKSEINEIIFEISSLLKRSVANCEENLIGTNIGSDLEELRYMTSATSSQVLVKAGEEFRKTGVLISKITFPDPEVSGNVATFDSSTGQVTLMLEIELKKKEGTSTIFGSSTIKKSFPINAVFNKRKVVGVSHVHQSAFDPSIIHALAATKCAEAFFGTTSDEAMSKVSYAKNAQGLPNIYSSIEKGIAIGFIECTTVDPVLKNNSLDSCSF